MKLLNYFHHRVAVVFAAFSLFLSVAFGMFLYDSLYEVDDQVRRALLDNFEQSFVDHYRQTGEYLSGDGAFQIRVLVSGRDPIEAPYRALEPGYHEQYLDQEHVISGVLPPLAGQESAVADGPGYLLIHNDSDSHAINRHQDEILLTIELAVLGVSLLGILIGLLLSRQLSLPVRTLKARIDATDPDNPSLVPLARQDEFGDISHAYAETLDRVRRSLERERRFSGYASHELRTPVAVVKSSLNLWNACQRSEDVERAEAIRAKVIDRISDANQQMEEVIQTFLLLSRQQLDWDEVEALDLSALLSDLLEKYQAIDGYDRIRVETRIEPGVVRQLNPKAVRLILSTLLRNGFGYAAGTLSIALDQHGLLLSNDIDQLRVEQSEHFGFGLEIATQLCEQIRWRCDCRRSEQNRFIAQIRFDDSTPVPGA